MSEFEQLYRADPGSLQEPEEPRVARGADALAEVNPLCGDEITVSVRLGEGDVIEDVGFEGRGCAISQAATSMLTDLVKGRTAEEVAAMPKDELLEEVGIPPHAGAAQVRHPRARRAQGSPAQGEGHRCRRSGTSASEIKLA